MNSWRHSQAPGVIELADKSVVEISVALAHRRTEAKRQRCGGTSLRSSPRKNGSSARVLTMTAAADLIRATVHNRVDNQVRGASLANHRHRRSDRSRRT